MSKERLEELNHSAMQIILFAGNSRNYINEALRSLEQENDDKAEEILQCAKNEIIKAHKIQTDMIQETIDNGEFQTTLLFTHAQDTLMTIYSELNMAAHMISLFRKLEKRMVTL